MFGGTGVERRRREDRVAKGHEGVRSGEGCPLPKGERSPQKIFRILIVKMVSCGAFWVVFYVIESYNYKIAKGRMVAVQSTVQCTRFEMYQLTKQLYAV